MGVTLPLSLEDCANSVCWATENAIPFENDWSCAESPEPLMESPHV